MISLECISIYDGLWGRETLDKDICFVSLNAYSYLAKNETEFIGGAELQQVILARELVKNKFDVSFIVYDFDQGGLDSIDSIKVYPVLRMHSRYNKLISALKVLTSIWINFARVDSDIYFQACGGFLTGFIAILCKLYKKKFVYQIASDMDVDKSEMNGLGIFQKIFYNYGLKNANSIIAQNEYQQKLLELNYGLNSIVIKNPYPIPDERIKKSQPPIVLWVASIKPIWKRPELFLDLANDLPHIRFQMIGGPSSEENKIFYEKIKSRAKEIPNLDFIGFVPFHKIDEYFMKASLFVNTSSVEGFPNTFLQSWAARTPVVSLAVDPDEIICKYKLGYHSKDYKNLVKNVQCLIDDNKLRATMGLNGRMYLEHNHSSKLISKSYIRVFESLER